MGQQQTIDPITLEIVWRRFTSIVDESEAVIAHTSFSSTVGEASDFSAVILDARGRLFAQTASSALGGFVGVLPRAARTVLKIFQDRPLRPGDVIVTNDPWICAGHLPDMMMLRPIFFNGRVVGYAANIAHLSDVGGRVSAEATDVFQEGLQIPPSFLYHGDKLNHDVMNFIKRNSRTPKQIEGDIQAQVAACRAAEQRSIEALREYRLTDLEDLSDAIQDRTETAMRAAIRDIPDGDYKSEVWSDGIDESLRIAVNIQVRGDEILVDYSGTSPQVDRGINCPFNLTYAETVYPLHCALVPNLPVAEGSLAPIKVSAPEGTVINPRYPAPVMIRVAVIHNAHAAIFRALSGLVPQYIAPTAIAAHSGGVWAFRFAGSYREVPRAYKGVGLPQESEQYVQMYLFNGGVGATGGCDGANTKSVPANVGNVPIEVMEARCPVLFERKELMPDSGGVGEYRGGLGQRVVIRNLDDKPIEFIPGAGDRIRNKPFGLVGGGEGSGGGIYIDGTAVHPRKTHILQPNHIVEVCVPGGGGFGRLENRDVKQIAEDLRLGYVTPQGGG